MRDPIDRLESDAALIGKLARTFDQMGINRGTEALLAVENELRSLAAERREAAAALTEATTTVDALLREVRLLRETITGLPASLLLARVAESRGRGP
jgi:hypothetical protein